MSNSAKFYWKKKLLLDDLIEAGAASLGRGNVISKIDIKNNPGPFPIYSSSAKNDGKMGEYGDFMFDEELISWSVDGGGYFFHRPKHKFSVTNVSGFMRLSQQWDYKFAAYNLQFQHDFLSFDYQSKAHPSVIRELYYFPEIDRKEQQKVASILAAVDDVIESTQAQINKLKDLKTGMMQELLTRGIGHTEFKDSPVGRIPMAWATTKIEDVASYITSGSRGWAEYYSKAGAIFIRIGNLTREHINFRLDDIVYVNPPEGGEGKRTLVQVGDVLISITADLGIVGVVNDSVGEAYVNQHVSLVRLLDTKLSRWVGHFLAHENSQKQFTASNDSGAKAGLNLSAIRNIEIALPPEDEREVIVRALDSIDSDIVNRRKKLGRSMEIKKALMQDLLTGKVRVKVN